jgi:hypothetical protein
VSAFTFFSLMAHTVSSHRDDWSCYPVPERCAIGKILCSGKFVIVGVRPWHDDTVLDDFGKFDSVAAARATMQAHGCPEVKQ